jgi:hypothetical protein
MKNEHIILLVLILSLLSVSSVPASSVVQLAKSGKTRYVISLAQNASAPEKNAASELSIYLKAITGADFKIISPSKSGKKPVIAVGPGAAKIIQPKLSLEKSKLGDDGIVMKSIGSNIVLTGATGSKRGTLYAVYTFLEDICGVRWWTSKDKYVPHKPNLAINNLNITHVPVFRYREALYNTLTDASSNPTLAKFLVQEKYNGDHNRIPADWGGSYSIIGWCHTFEVFMPPDKYFKDHPEWFSEINGKRVADRSQLCCTNDAMIAELTKNVLETIAKQPDAGIISVSQNDWIGNCQCANCKAMDEAEGSPSGSLIYCINKVAEAVEQKYPDFLVETLAYQHTRKPPKSIRPRNNVLVRLALIERASDQPIDNPYNQKLMDDLTAWKKAVPNLFIWDYTANMPWPFTPHPNLSVIAPDARTYAANHVVGVFNEGNHYAGAARSDFDELKTYVMSHMLWNPNQNEKLIIKDFLNGYYSKAGPILKQYLDILETKSRKVVLGSWDCGPDAAWLDLDAMNQSTKLFDRAESLVAKDTKILDRVRRARIPLDHQWLRGWSIYHQAAKAENKPYLGPADIKSATQSLISRLEKYEGNNICLNIFSADISNSLEDYAQKLRKRADTIANPTPLPTAFAGLPGESVVDVQESDMVIKGGASLASDPKASNGFAAKIDPAVLNWSVQFPGIGGIILPGKLHVYASVKCEKIKDTGVAFTAGIYDDSTRTNLVGLSVNLEDGNSVSQVDPNVKTIKSISSIKGAGDGEYHMYDFGVHDLNNQCYVWFGTTGGVSPENVKAIYIDRIIFVRE